MPVRACTFKYVCVYSTPHLDNMPTYFRLYNYTLINISVVEKTSELKLINKCEINEKLNLKKTFA